MAMSADRRRLIAGTLAMLAPCVASARFASRHEEIRIMIRGEIGERNIARYAALVLQHVDQTIEIDMTTAIPIANGRFSISESSAALNLDVIYRGPDGTLRVRYRLSYLKRPDGRFTFNDVVDVVPQPAESGVDRAILLRSSNLAARIEPRAYPLVRI
jgi:hypothetical protein